MIAKGAEFLPLDARIGVKAGRLIEEHLSTASPEKALSKKAKVPEGAKV
jgi:hypothetical protein